MLTIKINNNRGQLIGDTSQIRTLQKSFKIRNPNAFFLRRYMPKGWDGKQDYISDSGTFNTGLLQQIVDFCKDEEWKVKVIDGRLLQPYKINIKPYLNDQEYRPYQLDCLSHILNNQVEGIQFIRGVIKAATNAGKTNIIAGIYDCTKVKTIVILNSKDLFDQMVDDFPKLVPGKWGILKASDIQWNDIMICMAQTLVKRLSDHKIATKLREYGAVLVDEGDLADSATYKKILRTLYTTHIRLCFSGSVLVSDLAKYKIKNQNIKSFFGSLLYEIRNDKLQELGYSSQIKIVINKGNTDKIPDSNFEDEYLYGIIKSKSRNGKIIKRIQYHLSKDRNNILITVKNHKHVSVLYKRIIKAIPHEHRIEWVHHQRKDRPQIIKDFKEGRIKILVSSLIVKRGLNFPLMTVMINASGGLSPENALQLLGRATRKHESKELTYFEDFYDQGRYLQRHSKRRINTYKNEKMPMLNLYKLNTIK